MKCLFSSLVFATVAHSALIGLGRELTIGTKSGWLRNAQWGEKWAMEKRIVFEICSDHSISLVDTVRPDAGPLCHFTGHLFLDFYVKIAFSPDGTHLVRPRCSSPSSARLVV